MARARFYLTGTHTKYETKKIEISVAGTKREISFNDLSLSDENLDNSKNPVSINNSEIFQTTTTFDGVNLSEIIKSNIKGDYKHGISNGIINVPCIDYFDINGNNVKEWANGQIVDTNDVVIIEGDNARWRVTGRKFAKTGVPFVELELQGFTYHILRFDTDGGSVVKSKKVLYNMPIGDLENTIRVGYHNDGWTIDGEPIDENTIYKYMQDKVARVEWINNTYSVFYDSNSGTGQMNFQDFFYDVPQNLYKNSFKKEGHVFVGWSTDKNDAQAMYFDMEEVTNLTAEHYGSVTLYAIWEVGNPLENPTIIASSRIGINADATIKDVTITSNNADQIYYSVNSSTTPYPAMKTPNTLYTGQFTIQNTSNSPMYYTISAYAVRGSDISDTSFINTSIATGTGSGSSSGGGIGGGGGIGNL